MIRRAACRGNPTSSCPSPLTSPVLTGINGSYLHAQRFCSPLSGPRRLADRVPCGTARGAEGSRLLQHVPCGASAFFCMVFFQVLEGRSS